MMTLVRCLLEEKVTHLVKTKVMINILKHLQEGEADLLVKTHVKAMSFMVYPHFECKDQDQAGKADCKLTKNKNMLMPPLPVSRSSIRKKINQSADPVHIENVQNKDKPDSQESPLISTITANDSIKIEMTVCNSLMEKKWANAMKKSCLILNKLV